LSTHPSLHPRCNQLVVHVGRRVYTILRKFGKLHLKALLDRLEHGLIFWAAHEGDTETLGTETTSTTDTMEVGVSLVRHVVVDSDVDALNIDTTTKDIRGDANSGLELLELLVALDAVN
jgi:hypothetical protein